MPCLARSVGFGPVLSPPQRSLGHGSVQRLPLEIQAFVDLKLQQARPPELPEDPGGEVLFLGVTARAGQIATAEQGRLARIGGDAVR